MRNLLAIIVAGLLAMVPAVASAGLLGDEGFEGPGLGPWSYSEHSTEYIENFDSASAARSGSEGLEISWTAPIAVYLASMTEQSVAVTVGDSWNASVYAETVNIVGGASAYLETLYYMEDGGCLGDASKLQSDFLSGTTGWTLLTNSGIVPEWAATASYRLVVATGGDSMSTSGTVYFDDADAAVPEPTSLILLGCGLVGLVVFKKRK